jgi:hypothetical protein
MFMDRSHCLLSSLQNESEKLKRGAEVKIITKKGVLFKGILFDLKEGYVQTITSLGILVLFPLNSITNIYQI